MTFDGDGIGIVIAFGGDVYWRRLWWWSMVAIGNRW